MKLSKIKIQNYKGLLEEEFSPTSFSCLVGENNAGKSTLMQAIDYSLGLKTKLDEKVFYDPEKPIIFDCFFTDVEEADLERLQEVHRNKLKPDIYNNQFSYRLIVRHSEKGMFKVLKPVPKEKLYRNNVIDDLFKGKTKKTDVEEVMRVNYPNIKLPEKVSQSNCKASVKEYASQLAGEDLEMGESELASGISQSIANLLPEVIYIPAVKNLEEDARFSGNKGTSFSKIIQLILDDIKDDFKLFNDAMDDLNSKLNRLVDEETGAITDNRHKEVIDTESRIEHYLKKNFPYAKVELEIPPPELKSVFSSAKLLIDDGSKDQVDAKGDGIKRSLIFSLLQVYVEKLEERRKASQDEGTAESKRKPLIFLFEEPELYLHPNSQMILFRTLESISKDYQVMVTTHSPAFFYPGVTADFTRVAKVDHQPKPIGKLHNINFDLSLDDAQSFKLAKYEHADAAFFSNKVVLFEGESDEFFLNHISKIIGAEHDFSINNISLVKCGGKGSFKKFKNFFNQFGIAVYIICDLDCITSGFESLGASAELVELKNQSLTTINEKIKNGEISGEVSDKKIKKSLQKETWAEAYKELKELMSPLQEGDQITLKHLELIQELFVWEKNYEVLNALETNKEAKNLINPLFEKLREENIFILKKGAIESYYPESVSGGTKPEKAISAIELIKNLDDVQKLSEIEGDNETELEVIIKKISL